MPEIYVQAIGKSRSGKKEIIRISDAVLVEPFVLKVFFNNCENRIIDFHPFFNALKGDYKKYNTPKSFTKFKIKNGELWWGKKCRYSNSSN